MDIRYILQRSSWDQFTSLDPEEQECVIRMLHNGDQKYITEILDDLSLKSTIPIPGSVLHKFRAHLLNTIPVNQTPNYHIKYDTQPHLISRPQSGFGTQAIIEVPSLLFEGIDRTYSTYFDELGITHIKLVCGTTILTQDYVPITTQFKKDQYSVTIEPTQAESRMIILFCIALGVIIYFTLKRR